VIPPFQGGGAQRRGLLRGEGSKQAALPKDKRDNFALSWGKRVLSAALERTFDGSQAQYAAHRTTKDYIWNTIGFATWGLVFPLMTIVASQLTDVETAGQFSMAFIIATVLYVLGNYGMRPFQVSDVQEKYSFSAYQKSRLLSCVVMLIIGVLYCLIRQYDATMSWICVGIFIYKFFDAFADVYEGRLQQADKLYLGGISQTVRSVAVFAVATICLVLTRNLIVASMAMAVAAAVTFLGVSLPLALLETPKTQKSSLPAVVSLLKVAFPLFAALFLYTLVDNMPKFTMDGVLPYSDQLFFNALYFPAQAILLTVGFIYKPQLTRLAQDWADPHKRRRFDLFIVAMLVVIIVITLIGLFLMNWIGMPVFSFLYGVDFSPYKQMALIMVVAGGVTGVIDFLYQIIAVLRRQQAITKLYLITFGFSLMILLLLVPNTGLPGAVIGYLIVMTILLVLIVWQYGAIRVELREQAKGAHTV
jgi:O-antigen/teichoic acid export membrane protein